MKKVRVLKEMGIINKGEVFQLQDESVNLNIYCIERDMWVTLFSKSIQDLVNEGWLSWVEEPKSLEDKFQVILDRERGMYKSAKEWEKGIKTEMAGCAKAHFLKMVDATVKQYGLGKGWSGWEFIRNALESW